MIQINITDKWYETFNESHIGFLLINRVDNRKTNNHLNIKKKELESRLRKTYQGFQRPNFLTIPELKAYRDYYKRFKKTYHVQLQLESIVLKSKSLPNVSPMVDANFAAELESLVLTAGHDADRLELPILIDASASDENFIAMNGKKTSIRPNDMIMRDQKGVVCSIIYGQDNRTFISKNTSHALYVAYAPEGVPLSSVQLQLDTIAKYVLLASPNANVELKKIFSS